MNDYLTPRIDVIELDDEDILTQSQDGVYDYTTDGDNFWNPGGGGQGGTV